MIVSFVVQIHIIGISCFILTFHPIIDFPLHIAISLFINRHNNHIYNYMHTHRSFYYKKICYFISNYNADNYIRWKRYIIVFSCAYACIMLLIVKLDNYIICKSIIQSTIGFFINEEINHKFLTQQLGNMREYLLSKKYAQSNTIVLNQNSLTMLKSGYFGKHHWAQ